MTTSCANLALLAQQYSRGASTRTGVFRRDPSPVLERRCERWQTQPFHQRTRFSSLQLSRFEKTNWRTPSSTKSLRTLSQWLHEGIAQLVEGKSTQSSGRQLSQLFRQTMRSPSTLSKGNFMGFSAIEARLAYDQSSSPLSNSSTQHPVWPIYKEFLNASDKAVPPRPLCVQPFTRTTANSRTKSPATSKNATETRNHISSSLN